MGKDGHRKIAACIIVVILGKGLANNFNHNMSNHDKLLLIFIHGFKGHDKHTFLDFPNKLRNALESSLPIDVDSIVYPTYETKGDLSLATRDFCNWLNGVLAKQNAKRIDRSGRTFVVLCGHSMGGILAADAILEYQAQPSSPTIIALIAYDTPFYSIHSDVLTKTAWDRVGTHVKIVSNAFANISMLFSSAAASKGSTEDEESHVKDKSKDHYTKDKYIAYVEVHKESNVEVNKEGKIQGGGWSWSTIATAGAAAVVGGVAIYSQRDKVQEGFAWVTDHLQFVGVLANMPNLTKRVDEITKIPDLTFHCFYTKVNDSLPHTFIALPPVSTHEYFSETLSTAPDVIDAHMYMFDGKRPQYYNLSTKSTDIITKAFRSMHKRN